MKALTFDELLESVRGHGLTFSTTTGESRKIAVPTGDSFEISMLPPDPLHRRQIIFRLFQYLRGSDFIFWLERRHPPRPLGETYNIVYAYRRGMLGILNALGINPNVAGALFKWDEHDVVLNLILLITMMQLPGYDDLYLMPIDKPFVFKFDHDDLIMLICSDHSYKEQITLAI